MIAEMDELTSEGRTIGAINTVFLRKAKDGSTRYIGTNTDCVGVREAFFQSAPGASARAVGKPTKVYLVNRIQGEVDTIITHFQSTGSKGGSSRCLHLNKLLH